MEEITFNDILEYKKILETRADGNSTDVILNGSILHAVMIFTQLFKKATKDEKPFVNMFCGSLSILRNSTEKKVKDELAKIKHDDNDKLQKEWENFKPYEDFLTALREYLKRGVLRVIIENPKEGFRNERLQMEMMNWVDGNHLIIRKCKSFVYLNHFAYTGYSYRVEGNDDSKTALCCFKAEKTVSVFAEAFSNILRYTEPYCISLDQNEFGDGSPTHPRT